MRSPDTVIAARPPTPGGPPAGRATGAAFGVLGESTGSAVVTEFLSRAYRAGYLLGDAKVVDEHHRPEQQRYRHSLTVNVKQGAAGFFAHADLRADEGVFAHLEVTIPGLGDLVTCAERVLDRGGCFIGPYSGTAHFDVWHGPSSVARNPALTCAVRDTGNPGTPAGCAAHFISRFVPSVSTRRTGGRKPPIMTPDIGVAPALGQRGRHGAIFYLWPAIACHTDGYLCPA